MSEQIKNRKRVIEGEVISDKTDKTVVIEASSVKTHPKYLKKFKVTSRFTAHDPKNEYHIGDILEIEEMRPMSKTKRWKVVRKVK